MSSVDLNEALKDLLVQLRDCAENPFVKQGPPAVHAFQASADALEKILREHGVL